MGMATIPMGSLSFFTHMRQAMIFAAGLGTRLRPLTDSRPKALVEVGGQPLLWHVIRRLQQSGFDRIVVNVHHFARQIVDYLAANDHFGLDIRVSDETSLLLETGGGIKKALPLLDPSLPLLVHNVDIFSNARLDALYDEALDTGADALLLVSRRQTKRYLLFGEDRRLRGWTNVETGEVKPQGDDRLLQQLPTLERLAFSGIHVLSPAAYSLFADMPRRFGIIDYYLKFCHSHSFVGKEQPGLRLLDVGKPDSLSEASHFLQDEE